MSLRALPGIDSAAISNLLQARALGGIRPAVMLGHAFTITAETDCPGGLHVRRTTVIRLTGRLNAPFWVYRWGLTGATALETFTQFGMANIQNRDHSNYHG